MSITVKRRIKLINSAPLNIHSSGCSGTQILNSTRLSIPKEKNPEMKKRFKKSDSLLAVLSESKRKAGFDQVEIKIPTDKSNPIRIIGTNDSGGAMVTEFVQTDNGVDELTSEIINVDECEKAQKKFEKHLRRYAKVKVLNMERTGTACDLRKNKKKQDQRKKQALFHNQHNKRLRRQL